MRLDPSKINPLKDLLDSIPDRGVELTHPELSRIAMFFNSGGVFCENWDEVLVVLNILADQGLVTLTKQKNSLLLQKVNHGN